MMEEETVVISKPTTTMLPVEGVVVSSSSTSSSSPFPITAPLVSTLQNATDTLVIYGEVQCVVQSLVEDIEMAQSFNESLRHQREMDSLQRELKVAKAELEERRAYDKSLAEQLHTVGDLFVGELLVVTQTMNSLQQEVEKNRKKLNQFDSIQQKLQRSEELVRTLQRTMSFNRDAYYHDGGGDKTNTTGTDLLPMQQTHDDDGIENLPSTTTTTAIDNEEKYENVTEESKTIPQEQDSNFLESLDETLILHVFSYLDAIDVVHTAMVNVSFYARVDSLFGLSGGSGGGSSTPLTSSNQSTATTTTATTTTSSSTTDTPQSVSSKPTATSTTTTTNTTTDSSGSAAASAGASATSQSPTESSAAATSTVSNTKATAPPPPPRGGALANVLSRLGQPKTPQSATGRKKPLLTSSATDVSTSTTTTSSGSAPVATSSTISSSSDNAATTAKLSSSSWGSMANSMADKLTQAELAVIIRMVEQIRSKDREIAKITAEREDLAARLESTEAVKEFLISRVKDAERSLKVKEEEAAKALLQFKSDQEVIGYLDYRVKELERLWKESEEKFAVEHREYLDFKEKAQKRQIVLEDMLQFERQQLADSECEWKATKKVLVKEVKHCRAQLLALQAERDSYRHKNLQLKQALLTMNSSGAGPSK